MIPPAIQQIRCPAGYTDEEPALTLEYRTTHSDPAIIINNPHCVCYRV